MLCLCKDPITVANDDDDDDVIVVIAAVATSAFADCGKVLHIDIVAVVTGTHSVQQDAALCMIQSRRPIHRSSNGECCCCCCILSVAVVPVTVTPGTLDDRLPVV